MRFCPFSQRVEASLYHKGIPFEVVNIDLMSKPEWLGDKNPNLEVPILERDGQTIYDSMVILDFLEDMKPSPALLPTDSLKKAHHKCLMANCTKVSSGYFALMQAKGEQEKVGKAVEMMHKGISFYEKKLEFLGTPFLGGDKVGMADYVIFPWFERFPIYISDQLPMKLDILVKEKFPLMSEWFLRMKETPGIKRTETSKGAAVDLNHHIGFIKTIMFEQKFNYDFGLED